MEVEEVEEEPLFEIVLAEGEVIPPEILKAKIDSISYYGETEIIFTKAMRTEFLNGNEVIFDLNSINSTVLDLYLEPAEDRHL